MFEWPILIILPNNKHILKSYDFCLHGLVLIGQRVAKNTKKRVRTTTRFKCFLENALKNNNGKEQAALTTHNYKYIYIPKLKWCSCSACIPWFPSRTTKLADLTKAGIKPYMGKVSLHVFLFSFFQIFVVNINMQPKQRCSPSVRNSTSSPAGCSCGRKQQGFKRMLSKKKHF